MYQHILDAANNGDLLFGFGRLHGERLEKVLEQQQVSQRKIRYLTMAAFIAEQLRLYPQ
jgi:hypothetical protein